MAVLNTVPPPFGDRLVNVSRPGYKPGTDPQEGLMAQVYVDYFSGQTDLTEKFPARVFNVELTGVGVNIAATDMTDGGLSAGLYRLSGFVHITATDPGGSLDVVLDWRTEGATLTYPVASFLTAATTDFGAFSVPLLYVDALSPVRYAVTYNSGLGGAQYSIWLTLEEILA